MSDFQPVTRELQAGFVQDLIGTPWERGSAGPDSYDCWTMASYVQKALFARDLPLAPSLEIDTTDHRAVIEAIRTSPLQRQWLPVQKQTHGDLALMYRNGGESHCGVWLDLGLGEKGVLHCARGIGTVFQSLPQLAAQYRGVQFRRPAEKLLNALSNADETPFETLLGPDDALAVIVRDPVQPLIGAEYIPIEPGQSPANVVAGLSVRFSELLKGHWCILDKTPLLHRHPETGADEWVVTDIDSGQVLWIVPEPPAGGGDGSSIFAAIAAIVVAIAAPYLVAGLGFAALGTAAGSLTLAGNILAAGIALGGSLLISALVQPSLPQGPEALESPSPTYTLSPPGNQLRPGGQVPRPYGSIRRQPDLLARPYGEFAENEQLFYTLLNVGLGKHRINEIGIGDTPVWTLAGGLTGSLDDVEIETLQPGERVTLFPADVETSVEVGGQVMASAVDDGMGGLTETIVGPFVAVSSGSTANAIQCDYAFARGLFTVSEKGAQDPVLVTWRAELRKIDDDGDPIGGWVAQPNHSVNMGTSTPQRLTRSYPVAEGRYEVRVVRETASSDRIADNRGQDELSWVGLKAFIPGDQTFDDVTTIAIKARATETSSQAQRTWYVDSTAILPRWDAATETWIEEPTEAIEAAAKDIITAEYGLTLPESQIDMEALQEHAELWLARGDTCCLVIDTAQSCWDVLEAALGTGRTKPQLLGSTIIFMRDQPRTLVSQFLTHADMVRGSLEVVRNHFTREKPNVINARYWDRNGVPGTVECVPAGVVTKRPASVDFPGICDRDQVYREGVTMAAANYLRRTMLSLTILERGRALKMGELIAISHPRPAYGRPALVVSVDWPNITLSEPHGIDPEGAAQYLRLSKPDGGGWGPVLVTAGADDVTITVNADDFALVLANADPLATYSADPRDWIIPEETLEVPDPAEVEAAGGLQVLPTRAALGPDDATDLEAIVLGMRPRPDGLVELLVANEHPGVHTAETGVIPPAPAVSALSPLAGAPVWKDSAVSLLERGGVTYAAVGGPAAPGAVKYVAEMSLDNWESSVPFASVAPSIEFPVPEAEDVYLRWAAVGTIRGPWGASTVDSSAPAYDLASPTGLVTTEPPEPDFRFRWTAGLEATGWFGTLKVDGTTERTFSVSSPHYDYIESLQTDDGGPWRTVTLELKATRGSDESGITTLVATNPAPPAPAGLATGSIDENSVAATCTASADPSVRGYRFGVAASGAGSGAIFANEDSATPNATITGLSQNTSYDLFAAAYDASREGLTWSAAVPFTTASGGA